MPDSFSGESLLLPAAASYTPLLDETGFDKLKTGAFSSVQTAVGTFTNVGGKTDIDPAHRKAGASCLHLYGAGAKMTLDFKSMNVDTELAFWAERWTSRSPFSFTISAGGAVLYDGTQQIKVGGFNTHVRFAVPAGTKQLTFACTSPDDTGILIDSMRRVEPAPMEISGIVASQPAVPALTRLETNPILHINVEADGAREALSLNQVQAQLMGSDIVGDVEKVELLYTGTASVLGGDADPEPVASTRVSEGTITFKGKQELQDGDNHFWLSVKLKDGADLDGWIDAKVDGVLLSDNHRRRVENQDPEGRIRMAVAIRRKGDDGSGGYRIPGLATTDKGTLIGVYDIRHDGNKDLPAKIDVGMSRSTDGGKTWEPMKAIMDKGGPDEDQWHGDGIGDPAILFDTVSKTTWVIATWSHGNRSWHGSGPGFEPEETGQLMLSKSTDDGVTWSDPINITRQVKKEEWCFLLQGPGKGITMKDGTIVFPAQYQDTPEKNRLPYSTIIYSKDQGETWQIEEGPKGNTTESQVVELENGTLMLNMRDNRGGARSVYTTDDMGKTWKVHPTSRGGLQEPVCMASIINVDQELGKDRGGWLLFSNPNVPRAPRRRMTIKASNDQGMTWPEGKQVLLDEWSSAGYSCMSMIDDETVGILYEGSRSFLIFQRVKLADIID